MAQFETRRYESQNFQKGTLTEEFRRRMWNEDRTELTQFVIKRCKGNLVGLKNFITSLDSDQELDIGLEIVYSILNLTLEQREIVRSHLNRGDVERTVKEHLINLLDLELSSRGLVMQICNERRIFFPEEYPSKLLLNSLTTNPNGGVCDLYVKFPLAVGVHVQQEGGPQQSRRHSTYSWALPPNSGDFEMRGARSPTMLVELHDPGEVQDLIGRYAGSVRTLILDGHGDGEYLVMRSGRQKPAWELSRNELNEAWAAPLFECLAGTRSKFVLFSCGQGIEGGLAQQIHSHSGHAVYASPESINGLTIDIGGPKAHYVQFWKPRAGSTFKPAITRVFHA